MPTTFNSLLASAGLDPATVRVLRHQDRRSDKDRTPYRLWRDAPEDFETYQSRQTLKNARILEGASYWAVFVVTPDNQTLFVGLYKAGKPKPGKMGVPNVAVRGAVEDEPYMVFPLEKSDLLADFDSKLIIDWGKGFLAWIQHADRKNKDVLSNGYNI